MNFSQKLKILLSRKNYTQKEFAKKIDTHHQIVSRWLNGTKPSQQSINKIAQALDIDIEDLLSQEQPTTISQEQLLKKENELLKKEIELLKKELQLKAKK